MANSKCPQCPLIPTYGFSINQLDSYFMDLENYCLTVVDYNLANTVMLSRKSRAQIPGWINAITKNLDYDSEGNLNHKLSI